MSLLEIKDLTQRFGGLTALSDFSLNLERDELAGIIGPNGAGKTTVFNLITGVYRPTRGSIAIDGKRIDGQRPNRITSMGIARTFQNIRLFKELSVLDNVRCAQYGHAACGVLSSLFRLQRFRKEEAAIIDASMELLGLFQLDEYAQEAARNLPYGLQRRLEIARALATRPRLLLLDEPAAGMNPTEITRLMDADRLGQKGIRRHDPAHRAPDAARHEYLRTPYGARLRRHHRGRLARRGAR